MGAQVERWQYLNPGKTLAETLNISHQTLLYVEGVSVTFDGFRAPSIMEVDGAREVAVEFFTMSKSYNMAGWRIGFMVGNKDLVSALSRIKSYHDY